MHHGAARIPFEEDVATIIIETTIPGKSQRDSHRSMSRQVQAQASLRSVRFAKEHTGWSALSVLRLLKFSSQTY